MIIKPNILFCFIFLCSFQASLYAQSVYLVDEIKYHVPFEYSFFSFLNDNRYNQTFTSYNHPDNTFGVTCTKYSIVVPFSRCTDNLYAEPLQRGTIVHTGKFSMIPSNSGTFTKELVQTCDYKNIFYDYFEFESKTSITPGIFIEISNINYDIVISKYMTELVDGFIEYATEIGRNPIELYYDSNINLIIVHVYPHDPPPC